jgi:alpha-D-ribose 1-methylphosphonate 5-triphosphate diphosphatase PhnM
MDYISSALMDMTPGFSRYITRSLFKDYVEKTHPDKKVEDLSEEEFEKYRKEYENFRDTDYKNIIPIMAERFLTMASKSKDFVENFAKNA